MNRPLFAYPKGAAFGRIVAKEAIYRHSALSTAAKNLFVRQIERIIWQFKLAQETTNLPGTHAVPEIQIFSLQLKQDECAPEILAAIDKAVQFPVLFELCYQNQVKSVAAFKRPADANASGDSPAKWLISQHFASPWLPVDTLRHPLPQTLNLEMLYTALLRPLLPHEARPEENLAEQVARIEAMQRLQSEIDRCEKKLWQEKQYNRKIAVNQELRTLREKYVLLQ